MPPELSEIEVISRSHVVKRFDCGKYALNEYLRRYAVKNTILGVSKTRVMHRSGEVVAYYSLAPGQIERERLPHTAARRLPRYPVGIILLARLAVDLSVRGTGLGSAMLKDALLKAAEASDRISGRAVLVDALDDDAKCFYQHFGFEPCPFDGMRLVLSMQDVLASLCRR